MLTIHTKAEAIRYFGEPVMSIDQTADFQDSTRGNTPYSKLVYHYSPPKGYPNDGTEKQYFSGVEIYLDHDKVVKWNPVYSGPFDVFHRW